MAKKSKAFGVKRKAAPTTSKPNPFDFKFQRRHHNVIGDRKSANKTPLGTRKVAYEMRQNTIGKELKLLNKQNKIKDKRIGQFNKDLSDAQKAELRFVAQRKNQLGSKRNKFLLNDDDDNLERLASGLTEAEKYQRGMGHEANEEEELDPELMAAASFGGGSLNEKDENGRRLSRREIIKQAIERSAEAKAIKQRDRAIQLNQWERLDQQFTELKQAGELSFGRANMEKEEGDDEYMELLYQLELDTRAPAKREWAADITRKEIEEQEAEREAERLKNQTHTLFKTVIDKNTFPTAVDQISSIKISNSLDLARSIMICHDAKAYLGENRRYCPEIIGFLLNTLMIANDNACENLLSTFPTNQNFLHFDKKTVIDNIPPLSTSSLEGDKDLNELNKDRVLDLQVICTAVRLIRFFAQLYDNIFEAYPIIFSDFQTQLSRLPIDNYPELLAAEVKDTLSIVQDLVKQRSSLTHLHKSAAQKIKMVEMLEPRFEEHFNAEHPSHRRNDPQATVKRYQKRIKHEVRAATKELRKDAHFIAGEQAKVRREVDNERIQKTNRIFASLQTQESEFRKRKKGKKF